MCVCACVHSCVRACVRACVCACVRPWHLKINTVTIPKGGLHRRSVHPIWDVSASFWTELHETGGLYATLAVNRLGRRRATRPRNHRLLREEIRSTYPPTETRKEKKAAGACGCAAEDHRLHLQSSKCNPRRMKTSGRRRSIVTLSHKTHKSILMNVRCA